LPEPPAPRRRNVAHVLPAFDELLVGYADRSATLDASDWRRVTAGGIFEPVIVVEGRIVGTWRRRIEGRHLLFSSAPFAALSESSGRAVNLALRRYARFVGLGPRSPLSQRG
jgi:hypothetical protein